MSIEKKNEKGSKKQLDELIKELLRENFLELSKDKDAKLGSGSFGDVYEVHKINTKNTNMLLQEKVHKYALKIIKIDKSEKSKSEIPYEKRKNQINRELSLSLNIKHHNIIRTKQVFQKEDDNLGGVFCILMEKAIFPNLYFLLKSLHSKTKKENKLNLLIFEIIKNEGIKEESKNFGWFTRINEHFANFLIKQIFLGIEFLHRNHVIHFDMKPGNILITKDMQLKICDFTLTTFLNLDKKDDKYYLSSGTFPFMGPEYFSKNREIDKPSAPKVDIFALGVILLQFFYADPFKENGIAFYNSRKERPEQEEIEKRIDQVLERIKKDNNLSKECKDVLSLLLQKNINDRKTIYEILNENWVKQQNEEFNNILHTNDDLTTKFIIETMKCGKVKVDRKNKQTNHIYKKGFAKIKAKFKLPRNTN